jgi:hypothetical protein
VVKEEPKPVVPPQKKEPTVESFSFPSVPVLDLDKELGIASSKKVESKPEPSKPAPKSEPKPEQKKPEGGGKKSEYVIPDLDFLNFGSSSSDSKPAPKPQSKPEPTGSTPVPPKPAVKPEPPKPAPKPEPKPQPKPESKPAPKPETGSQDWLTDHLDFLSGLSKKEKDD